LFDNQLPERQIYGGAYWPDNGEIDLMEQVGYDPFRIHSTVHTKANNHMLNNHPSNSVIVGDATSNFKIYTLDWNVDKMEMFVGDEANPFQTRIFIWNKHGDWTTW
jgi:licheninase